MENQDTILPIERAAQGDEIAYAAVAERMTPVIGAIVSGFADLGSDLDTDDLKQEASVGLLAAVRTYRADGGASFITYASTCIRNRLTSVTRRHGARALTEQPFSEDDDLPAAADCDPAQQMQEREALRLLQQQLRRRLTDLEYQVLLARLSDRSYEQIAAQLGVSKKAVDNAVQRLRRKMTAPQ